MAAALESAPKRKLTRVLSDRKKAAADANHRPQVVVLAVDEARILKRNRLDWIGRLRRALVRANAEIGSLGGILVVLIDTDPKVANATPTPRLLLPPSYRDREQNPMPPLVLSRTMDSYWRFQMNRDGVVVVEEEDGIFQPLRIKLP